MHELKPVELLAGAESVLAGGKRHGHANFVSWPNLAMMRKRPATGALTREVKVGGTNQQRGPAGVPEPDPRRRLRTGACPQRNAFPPSPCWTSAAGDYNYLSYTRIDTV